MSKEGWIKVHRSLLDWEWYDDANTFRLWMHLLLTANHENRNWRGITIRKGQKLTSQAKLAEQLGLTRQQIRTSLEKLKSTKSITIEGKAQHTVFTVIEWNKYQQTTNETTSEQPAEQPADNQPITTNKNLRIKELKKDAPKKKKYEACDFEFAEKAFQEMLKYIPDFKKPNLENWAEEVRKMRTIDKRNLEEAARIWVWCRKDPVVNGYSESINVQSIGKLRKRYSQLKAKTFANGSRWGAGHQQRAESAARTFDPDINRQQLEGL